MKKFYEPLGEARALESIFLNEEKISFEEASQNVLDLPRPWYELSQISKRDRLDFLLMYWQNTLPYSPKSHPFFVQFFESLEDVSIVLVRRELFFEAEMVFLMQNGTVFFRGFPPASESELETLKMTLFPFPEDYLAFLKMYGGFAKLNHKGVLDPSDLLHTHTKVAAILEKGSDGIDPANVMPFFQDYSLNGYQCFYRDWYPENSVGNIYVSGMNHLVSERVHDPDSLSFISYLEWFCRYLSGESVSK